MRWNRRRLRQVVWSLLGLSMIFVPLITPLLISAGVSELTPPGPVQQSQSTYPLQPGSVAPEFALSDCNGSRYDLSHYRGTKVLLNFFCGCEQCQQMAQAWQRQFGSSHTVRVLALANFNPRAAREFCRASGMRYPLLLDAFGRVAEQYCAVECPRCWLINEEGRVVYSNSNKHATIREIRDSILATLRA